jgi:hypothetical protein
VQTLSQLLPPTEGGYLNQMTALHIRKNVREFFPWAASLPGHCYEGMQAMAT